MRLRFTFCFLLASIPLLAQEPLQISGELRQRSEYRQNADFDSRLGDEQIFVLQRLRLGLHWNFPNQLAAFVQMQDSRLWGEEGSTTQPLNNTDVHQAYFEMQRLAGKPLHVRLGRQEMKFGSQRLVGVNDWNNVGRAFDGVRFTLAKPPPRLIFGWRKFATKTRPPSTAIRNLPVLLFPPAALQRASSTPMPCGSSTIAIFPLAAAAA